MSEHLIYKRLYMLYVGHTINKNLKYDDDIALDRLEQHTDRLFLQLFWFRNIPFNCNPANWCDMYINKVDHLKQWWKRHCTTRHAQHRLVSQAWHCINISWFIFSNSILLLSSSDMKTTKEGRPVHTSVYTD